MVVLKASELQLWSVEVFTTFSTQRFNDYSTFIFGAYGRRFFSKKFMSGHIRQLPLFSLLNAKFLTYFFDKPANNWNAFIDGF